MRTAGPRYFAVVFVLFICAALVAFGAQSQEVPPVAEPGAMQEAPVAEPEVPLEPPVAQEAVVEAQPVPEPPDPRVEKLEMDLSALSRIAEVAENIDSNRQVMMAIVDDEVETLREPRGDGTYRWAALQRQEASRTSQEKKIARAYTEEMLDQVQLTSENAYRVEITLPQKQSLFRTNKRVFVKNVVADITRFDASTFREDIPVNVWVNPKDTHGVLLPEIGKSVAVTVSLGVESGTGEGVAEVSLIRAKLVDDPASPWYAAVTRLLAIREALEAKDINRGLLKQAIDESLATIPGRLEESLAQQRWEAERRAELMGRGESVGTIKPGDATPDVIAALENLGKLMTGTLEEQLQAREKLQALIESLREEAPPEAPSAKQ